MDFRVLRAFVEVVRQGGFSSAGKALFTTQSAVSKAVRQLEDEAGVALLDRIGHRVALTAAGEIVYRRALKLLADRDDLIAELGEVRGLKRGELRLGLPPIGSSTLYAPLFAIYRQRFPGVDVRLVEYGSDRLEELLRAGEIELAGSLLPVAEDFEWRAVRREPLSALLPAAHPLAGRPSLHLLDLKDTPFVLFERGFALNRILLDACRASGFEPQVAARSSQIDFIVELAALGLGAAFLPEFMFAQRPHPGVAPVRLDEPRARWDMAMVWRRGAYLSHAARAWLAIVDEAHAQA